MPPRDPHVLPVLDGHLPLLGVPLESGEQLPWDGRLWPGLVREALGLGVQGRRRAGEGVQGRAAAVGGRLEIIDRFRFVGMP